jgi:general secretion pathway protein J
MMTRADGHSCKLRVAGCKFERRHGEGLSFSALTSNQQLATSDRRSGFTLLEMLLAISMFAVIAVLVGAAMKLGYRSAESGDKKIETVERLRRSISIMEGQIQSSLPLTFDDGGERKEYFMGERKSLTVASNYSIWEGRKGYVVAQYIVKNEQSGKESLYASETIIGTEGKNETVLLKDCDLIEFAYLEKGLTKESTKWVDQWSNTDTGPERIRVRVRSGTWDYSLVIPVRVGGEA